MNSLVTYNKLLNCLSEKSNHFIYMSSFFFIGQVYTPTNSLRVPVSPYPNQESIPFLIKVCGKRILLVKVSISLVIISVEDLPTCWLFLLTSCPLLSFILIRRCLFFFDTLYRKGINLMIRANIFASFIICYGMF